MHKLLNINRDGGYPLCAENLSILDENARMINAVLSGLKIPNNTAILFRNNVVVFNSAVNSYFSYLYMSNGHSGELMKVGNDASGLLGNTENVGISVRVVNQNVTDEHGNEYEDVYKERYADIVMPTAPSNTWRVYDFSDVIETALYEPAASLSTGSLMTYVSSNGTLHIPISNENTSIEESNITKNNRELRLKASYKMTLQSEANGILHIKCNVGSDVKAPVLCYFTCDICCATVEGWIANNEICLPISVFEPSIEYTLFFNTTIIL